MAGMIWALTVTVAIVALALVYVIKKLDELEDRIKSGRAFKDYAKNGGVTLDDLHRELESE